MPANDPKDLIIPVGRFRAHATLPGETPALPASYTIDFGKFEKGVMKISGDLKEVWQANDAGYLGLDVVRRVKGQITYEFDLKHLSPTMLAYFMGSASGNAPIPGKVFDLWGWAAIESQGEPVIGATGAAVLAHHSFACGVTLDGDLAKGGDDFAMLKLTARVYLGRAPGLWTAAARPVAPA